MFGVFWFVVEVFDDVDDKLYVFDLLFNEIFDYYVLIRLIKVCGKLNFCIMEEICEFMKFRNVWCKIVCRINDLYVWFIYKNFKY